MVFEEKNIFTIKLKSEKGEVLVLKKNIFDDMLQEDAGLKKGVKEHFELKKDHWAYRIKDILK